MSYCLKQCAKLLRNLQILSPRRYLSQEVLRNASVLGIETSCDDTGCAVVDMTGKILGESLHSQNAVHVRYGGVNPLIANELHRRNIEQAVAEALENSNLTVDDIDAIAVTTRPGMLMSLQVGVKYAKYLARKHNKPLIPIHHMEAHALVVRVSQDVPFPYLSLLISGGHCLLAVVKDVDEFYLLGKSLDNAPGEVLDKGARRMKLKNIPTYSQMAGGRAIELAAKHCKDPDLFRFPLPLAKYRDCNFSFSGLKDALDRNLMKKELEHGVMGDGIIPEVNELCAAYQLAVAEHIAHRTERAVIFCEKNTLLGEYRNLVVSGGVACNDFIYKSLQVVTKKLGYEVYRPPPRLCTDNGVMIAWNGIEKLRKPCGIIADIPISSIEPVAPLGNSLINEVKQSNLPVRVSRLRKMCL
ncbi:tRNA N6-adenosine threonylcarbamoyltransferase, mitochondrial-like [Amyelois transitella]|uniref:tRNA N6-adenosine threonylcarbamoyltransferase, mitochondrial-like n=1 Tax=Amyelois transitella TaxID=680683 RepID=UPI00298FC0FA|nr:tRNA N6-adenosine threonylcarbamoyltransferase, mitochondrial-like [Amyelois transitella]